MKPKSVIFWLIFIVVAWNLFGYVKTHTSGDVIAFKQFAKAVMEGDDFEARRATEDSQPMKAFDVQEARRDALKGDVIFTYYRVRDRRLSQDGKRSFLVVDQVSRLNPEGYDTLWGEVKVTIRQTAELILEHDSWKVVRYNDRFMTQAQ